MPPHVAFSWCRSAQAPARLRADTYAKLSDINNTFMQVLVPTHLAIACRHLITRVASSQYKVQDRREERRCRPLSLDELGRSLPVFELLCPRGGDFPFRPRLARTNVCLRKEGLARSKSVLIVEATLSYRYVQNADDR